jgi:hypothetical protein
MSERVTCRGCEVLTKKLEEVTKSLDEVKRMLKDGVMCDTENLVTKKPIRYLDMGARVNNALARYFLEAKGRKNMDDILVDDILSLDHDKLYNMRYLGKKGRDYLFLVMGEHGFGEWVKTVR